MLAVIDPALLDEQSPISLEALTELVRLIRQEEMQIPGGTGTQGPAALLAVYASQLQRRIMRLNEVKSGRAPDQAQYRQMLRLLGNLLVPFPLPALQAPFEVVDSLHLFVAPWLTPEECTTVTALVAHCAASGEPTMVLARLIEGRNARLRKHEHMECIEKLVWRLEVRIDGAAPVLVPCLCSSRNHAVPWTRRYDDELPAEEDGADFPFCPHPDWETDSALKVLITHTPGYAWQDVRGNRWRRPNTPGKGEHWDLFFGSQQLCDEYGDVYLNIVRWGLPPGQAAPGSIHHIQHKRNHRLKKKTGWRCK